MARAARYAAVLPFIGAAASSPQGQAIEGELLTMEQEESGAFYLIASGEGEEWIAAPTRFLSAESARSWWDDVVRLSPYAERYGLPAPRSVTEWIGV